MKIISQPRQAGKTQRLIEWCFEEDDYHHVVPHKIILCSTYMRRQEVATRLLNEGQKRGLTVAHVTVLSVQEVKNNKMQTCFPAMIAIDDLEDVIKEFLGTMFIELVTTDSPIICDPDMLELLINDKKWEDTKDSLVNMIPKKDS